MKFKQYLQESFLTSQKSIQRWLSETGFVPSEYTIHPNGVVDMHVSTYLYEDQLWRGKLPVKFGKVNGSFSLKNCNMVTLEGCPEEVNGHFTCDNNPRLTSLKGGPKKVSEYYGARYTNLQSLEGIAQENFTEHLTIEINSNSPLTAKDMDFINCKIDFFSVRSPVSSLVGIDKIFKKGIQTLDINPTAIKEGGLGILLIDGLTHLTFCDFGAPVPMQIIKKYVGAEELSALDCQIELIDNGYDNFAMI